MTNVGWIGTGVMGGAMCGHLLDAGHAIRVFSRTRERARPLIAGPRTDEAKPSAAT